MPSFLGVPDLRLTSDEYYIAMGVKKHPITHTVVIRDVSGNSFLPCISYEEAVSVRRSFLNYGKYQSAGITIETGEVKQ